MSNPYAAELKSEVEGWVPNVPADQAPDSRTSAHACATFGVLTAIPVVVSLSSAVLSVALGSIARLNAGSATSLDNVLAMLGFHMVLVIVLILFALPSFVLSLIGFIKYRDLWTTFALLLAVVPIPLGFFLLIVLG